jgi:hypothetical protein
MRRYFKYTLIGLFRKALSQAVTETPEEGYSPSLDFSNRFNSQYSAIIGL